MEYDKETLGQIYNAAIGTSVHDHHVMRITLMGHSHGGRHSFNSGDDSSFSRKRGPVLSFPTRQEPVLHTHRSVVIRGGPVTFPEWTGERLYMVPFDPTMHRALPNELRRWKNTISAMLDTLMVLPERACYVMIDQAELRPNQYHRRPGLHIDGYWLSDDATPEPLEVRMQREGLRGKETLLLASDVLGAVAYKGAWTGMPQDGGDCSHIDTSNMERVELEPNVCWALNVTGLHASIPMTKATKRTLIRINCPGV